ncbi:molybdate ABC transporter substrate-binding protein [Aestuariimicrobium soli]|uniref:molybdate ABC transporter substrate-binding protein n=1 Tax=Aestuariimicrobium soli TaxID=2035834 RepID=UPI003EBB9048
MTHSVPSRSPRRAAARAAALVLAAALALGLPACSSQPDTTTVFAAASLSTVFPQIADEAKTPATFSFDGSSGLVDQLEGGAPADVLATADKTTMDRAVKGGLVETPREFATNQLALVVPKGNPAGVTDLADLDGKKLVICAPEVPCGRATLQVAQDRSITLKPVSEELKVTDVVGKVASGEADAGVAYTTDANDEVEVITLPGADKRATHLYIARVKGTTKGSGADAFIAAVTGETGRRLLTAKGFGPAGAGV